MSAWDSYLNTNIATGSLVDKAIIIDQTGQAVWGKSSSIQLTPDQMKKIAQVFNDPTEAQGNGLHFESQKYIFNKIDDIENIPVMHSKSGKEGILAVKCKASILIAHYPANSSAGDAINFIHGQAKYLIQNNL